MKKILYRLEGSGIFKNTGKSVIQIGGVANVRPNSYMVLPVNQKKTVIWVKYIDGDNKEQGPFKLLFDPEAEYTKQVKNIFNNVATVNWVSFGEAYGKQLMYVTHIQVYRGGLRKVRYSFIKPSLDLTLELLPDEAEITGQRCIVKIPKEAKKVYIQLTYRDGTKSEVKEFSK